MQLFAFENDLADIPYNFLIGGDGNIYEGRGFHFKGEIFEKESSTAFENLGLIIAFIGTFQDKRPNSKQISTFKIFLESLVDREVVSNDFKLLSGDQITNAGNADSKLLEFLMESVRFYSRKKNLNSHLKKTF